MIKVQRYIILLSFLSLLLGCSNNSAVSNKIATNLSKQDNTGLIKTNSFEYFFRGFITLKESQVQSYPHDTYIIETDEDWHDFMDKYVPGIPYYTAVDYSKECLIFTVGFPAWPSYSDGSDIKTFTLNEGKLEPEYVNYNSELGESNGIYAQNIDGIEHCFVNIVKINKKDIPRDISNIYHKGDILKN